jgi:hypothetical protein
LKTSHTFLALLLVASAATFVFAGEGPHVERHVKLAFTGEDGGEPLVIEADDLEVGETRQFFTESGKEVVLTRTEEGYDLEVDGEKIDVDAPGAGHYAFETGDSKRVFVFQGDHGDAEGVTEDEHVFIHQGEEGFEWVQAGGDGEEGFEWVQAGDGAAADVHFLHAGHPTALEHLRAKGILDELDEATRQKIVDALTEIEPEGHQAKKMIMIKVDEKVHEDSGPTTDPHG